MVRYVIKRILLFIPTLIAISLLTFILSINAPGDPVERILTGGVSDQMQDKVSSRVAYIEKRKSLKLDLPVFYFSLKGLSFSKDIYQIIIPSERATVEHLLAKHGNEKDVFNFYQGLKKTENLILQKGTYSNEYRTLLEQVNSILNAEHHSFEYVLKDFGDEDRISKNYANIINEEQAWKTFVPCFYWHGFNNQYHHWLSNFIKGDFGISYIDKRPVSDKVWDALSWTLILSLLSIILSYLIAIPVGIYSAVKRNQWFDKSSSVVLFILYSLPSFWVATILLSFFANPDYFVWFDPLGFKELAGTSSMSEKISILSQHIWVPLFCLTYGSFAFLSRQMRGAMLEVLQKDFIRTANAKGLSEKWVIIKHALKNSLLPIITLFANVFPFLIGGSIIIEQIFSIPGMGRLGLDAIVARDYPVIFTITMFAAIMTLIGYMVADVLYVFADPRIRLEKK